ncbi:hypothetical protein DENSPDRAFT_846383, partial [Dentipellis sp. KUC8613]
AMTQDRRDSARGGRDGARRGCRRRKRGAARVSRGRGMKARQGRTGARVREHLRRLKHTGSGGVCADAPSKDVRR